jgi:hypothetical protein
MAKVAWKQRAAPTTSSAYSGQRTGARRVTKITTANKLVVIASLRAVTQVALINGLGSPRNRRRAARTNQPTRIALVAEKPSVVTSMGRGATLGLQPEPVTRCAWHCNPAPVDQHLQADRRYSERRGRTVGLVAARRSFAIRKMRVDVVGGGRLRSDTPGQKWYDELSRHVGPLCANAHDDRDLQFALPGDR